MINKTGENKQVLKYNTLRGVDIQGSDRDSVVKKGERKVEESPKLLGTGKTQRSTES